MLYSRALRSIDDLQTTVSTYRKLEARIDDERQDGQASTIEAPGDANARKRFFSPVDPTSAPEHETSSACSNVTVFTDLLRPRKIFLGGQARDTHYETIEKQLRL